MHTRDMETRVLHRGWEDPLEDGMATHSSILAWKLPWTEEPGGLWSMGSQSGATGRGPARTHQAPLGLPPGRPVLPGSASQRSELGSSCYPAASHWWFCSGQRTRLSRLPLHPALGPPKSTRPFGHLHLCSYPADRCSRTDPPDHIPALQMALTLSNLLHSVWQTVGPSMSP